MITDYTAHWLCTSFVCYSNFSCSKIKQDKQRNKWQQQVQGGCGCCCCCGRPPLGSEGDDLCSTSLFQHWRTSRENIAVWPWLFSLSLYLAPWRYILEVFSSPRARAGVRTRVCEIERACHDFPPPGGPWPLHSELGVVLSNATIFVHLGLACAPRCTPNTAHGKESPARSFKATPGGARLVFRALQSFHISSVMQSSPLKWLQNQNEQEFIQSPDTTAWCPLFLLLALLLSLHKASPSH